MLETGIDRFPDEEEETFIVSSRNRLKLQNPIEFIDEAKDLVDDHGYDDQTETEDDDEI